MFQLCQEIEHFYKSGSHVSYFEIRPTMLWTQNALSNVTFVSLGKLQKYVQSRLRSTYVLERTYVN